MKSILLAAMNGVLILFTVLVHKIIFRILGLGYDNLVIYWGLFVLIFFIFDVILNFFFLKDKGIFNKVDIRFSIAVNCIVFFINFDDCNIEDIKKILNKK